MNTATSEFEFETIAPRFLSRAPAPDEIGRLKSMRREYLSAAWDCQKTILKIRWIAIKTAARIAFVRTMHSLTFWASSAGLGWGLAASSIGWIIAGF